MWEDGFDIFGAEGFVVDPYSGYYDSPDTVETPNLEMGDGVTSLDNIMINPTTMQLQTSDGQPLSSAMEAAIREAYQIQPLEIQTYDATGQPIDFQDSTGAEYGQGSMYQPNATAEDVSPEQIRSISDTLRSAGMGQGGGITDQEVQSAIQDPNPSPGVLARIAGALTDPNVLTKLLVTGGSAAVSLLATKLLADPATAPSGQKIRAQMEAMQPAFFQTSRGALTGALAGGGASDLQSAIRSGLLGNKLYQQYLTGAIEKQAPAEQDIRDQSIAQVARVMAGQYSNPLLDYQSQQRQEQLENLSAQRGGNAAWLQESTPGQRAQMFKNLEDSILRESDRRATLAQIAPMATSYGTAMNPAIGMASRQPQDYPVLGLPGAQTEAQQAARYLQDAQLRQYQAEQAQNLELAKGIGGVAKDVGAIIGGSV